MKIEPQRSDIYGPSDETLREVSMKTFLGAVALTGGYVLSTDIPPGVVQIPSFLFFVLGIVLCTTWGIEWMNRVLLWKNTRRYER